MPKKLFYIASFAVFLAPASAEIQISEFDISSDRQVAIVLGADQAISHYQLEYLANTDPPVWLEDARAMIEVDGNLVQAFTRLPDKSDARYFRMAGMESRTTSPLQLSEIVSDNVSGPQAADESHPDWIELVNTSDQPIAIGGYGLGDDPDNLFKTVISNQMLGAGARLLLLLEDFGIDATGETVYFTSPDGSILESVKVPPLDEDESLARRGEDWFVMDDKDATPGEPNTDAGDLYVSPPRFSIRGGRFSDPLTVRLASKHTIRFTTDGSEPDENSPVYEQPFQVEGTVAIRAQSFDAEGNTSPLNTQTYLVGLNHTLPVVAMTAPPENFEFHRGYLYGMGSVLSSSGLFRNSNSYPYSSSNAWKNREVKTNLELIEPDGERGFNVVAGIKIFGGWGSRGYPQKSFAVFARRKYGFGKIRYQLFPDQDVHDFETFVLRQSGNDNQSTHLTYPRSEIRAFGPAKSYGSYFVNGNFTLFRDAMLGSLGKELGLDTQGYRPAVVYLNGKYWGIYNIREKLNEHYLESHFGVPNNKVDLIEGYGSANSGSGATYSRMRSLVNRTNTEEDYREVEETYLDIANFIDYYLSVIFFQNFDIGNIKCWRSREEGDDGRFRWLLYDQDYGFNLWPEGVYQPAMKQNFSDYENMFTFYTNTRGSGWPNGADRTLLLAKMLGIEEFETRFILRCADLLNSTFHEEHVTTRIEDMADVIRPEIPAHLERWSFASIEALGFGAPHKMEDAPLDLNHWERNVQTMINFGKARPAQLRLDLIDHFKLEGGLAKVVIEPANFGSVQVNTLAIQPEASPWEGTYFVDYAPPVTAIPSDGYRFVKWVGNVADPNAITTSPTLVADQTVSLQAEFEPIE